MINIYTDGACSGNPGPGGWGYCAVKDSEVVKEDSHYNVDTTNNRMELTAFLQAIRWATQYVDGTNLDEKFTIYVDSKYVVDSITKGWLLNWKASGWKKSSGGEVLNRDLWEQVAKTIYGKDFTNGLRLMDRLNIVWCKGHDGLLGNEHADTLACAARDQAKKDSAILALEAEDKYGND